MSEPSKINKKKTEDNSDLGEYNLQSSTMVFRRNLNRIWKNDIRRRNLNNR